MKKKSLPLRQNRKKITALISGLFSVGIVSLIVVYCLITDTNKMLSDIPKVISLSIFSIIAFFLITAWGIENYNDFFIFLEKHNLYEDYEKKIANERKQKLKKKILEKAAKDRRREIQIFTFSQDNEDMLNWLNDSPKKTNGIHLDIR